jgi:hypothetical protein
MNPKPTFSHTKPLMIRLACADIIVFRREHESGKMLWQTKGDFTEEKNQQLLNASEESKQEKKM